VCGQTYRGLPPGETPHTTVKLQPPRQIPRQLTGAAPSARRWPIAMSSPTAYTRPTKARHAMAAAAMPPPRARVAPDTQPGTPQRGKAGNHVAKTGAAKQDAGRSTCALPPWPSAISTGAPATATCTSTASAMPKPTADGSGERVGTLSVGDAVEAEFHTGWLHGVVTEVAETPRRFRVTFKPGEDDEQVVAYTPKQATAELRRPRGSKPTPTPTPATARASRAATTITPPRHAAASTVPTPPRSPSPVRAKGKTHGATTTTATPSSKTRASSAPSAKRKRKAAPRGPPSPPTEPAETPKRSKTNDAVFDFDESPSQAALPRGDAHYVTMRDCETLRTVADLHHVDTQLLFALNRGRIQVRTTTSHVACYAIPCSTHLSCHRVLPSTTMARHTVPSRAFGQHDGQAHARVACGVFRGAPAVQTSSLSTYVLAPQSCEGAHPCPLQTLFCSLTHDVFNTLLLARRRASPSLRCCTLGHRFSCQRVSFPRWYQQAKPHCRRLLHVPGSSAWRQPHLQISTLHAPRRRPLSGPLALLGTARTASASGLQRQQHKPRHSLLQEGPSTARQRDQTLRPCRLWSWPNAASVERATLPSSCAAMKSERASRDSYPSTWRARRQAACACSPLTALTFCQVVQCTVRTVPFRSPRSQSARSPRDAFLQCSLMRNAQALPLWTPFVFHCRSKHCVRSTFLRTVAHLFSSAWNSRRAWLCRYVSGKPGAGKTATISHIVRDLRAAGTAAGYKRPTFVEFNCMAASEPSEVRACVRACQDHPATSHCPFSLDFTHQSTYLRACQDHPATSHCPFSLDFTHQSTYLLVPSHST
jgi:hypothetical protein